jgi:nucleotide-binding universal stress UspA family protein
LTSPSLERTYTLRGQPGLLITLSVEGDIMFKHLLVPTDGTTASEATIRQVMAIAKENGAKVTGLHVIQPFHVFAYHVDMIESTSDTFMAQAQARAERYVTAIEKAAKEMGVACETHIATGEHPFKVIIDTAHARTCDLIVMCSHGRSGVKGFLLGSETQKVLTHTTLPVLVLR